LAERGLGPDVAARGEADAALDFIHRRTSEADIYFVRNTTARPFEAEVTFRSSRAMAERWDPVSGEIQPLVARTLGPTSTVLLRFEPNGSFFVLFREGTAAPPKARAAALSPRPALPLARDWKVTFPLGGASEEVAFPALVSWTESSRDDFRFFSGIATYRKEVVVGALGGRRAVLDLGRVEATARVFVNDKEAGTLWTPPFALDVTNLLREGTNLLRVEVANLWPNRLIGDAHLPREKRSTNTNINRLPNAWSTPMKDLPSAKYGLLPSGLLGPVELRFE
jgi:hypothetical protein